MPPEPETEPLRNAEPPTPPAPSPGGATDEQLDRAFQCGADLARESLEAEAATRADMQGKRRMI